MLANCLYAALTNTICVPTPQLPLPIVHWFTRIWVRFPRTGILAKIYNVHIYLNLCSGVLQSQLQYKVL